MVTFNDFKKLDIIVARVENARDHPNADKLVILEVNVGGGKKEIVAGIKKFYAKEQLVGKDIVIVNNLEPATIRGAKSNGMLLAVEDEKGICLITPDKPAKPGSKIR
jgi:methionyl-tRNA synthetase